MKLAALFLTIPLAFVTMIGLRDPVDPSTNDLLTDRKPPGIKGGCKLESGTSLSAGASVDLCATVNGAGYVDHIWVGTTQYAVNIEVFVDGEVSPSIDQNVSDMVGNHFCDIGTHYVSQWVGCGSNGGSGQPQGGFFIPIPFGTSINIKLKNNSGSTSSIAAEASYQTGLANTWLNEHRLHAVFTQTNAAAANSENDLLNVSPGAGRLVGVGWLYDASPGSVSPATAPLEGNWKIYVDGSAVYETPGGEDMFDMGSYFNGFTAPTITNNIGLTFKTSTAWGAYRMWVTDPVAFTTSIRLTWACGNTSEVSFTGTCRIYSTVWYYTAT